MVEVEIPAVALALEHNRNKLAAGARTGKVLRVRRGAYCAPDEIHVDGPSGAAREARKMALARARALHLQLRAKHVFSHPSAALLLGCLVWTTPRETHIYQHYRASGHAADDVRRYSWTLAPDDVIEAAGLPVTSLARTVVDCARTLHPLEALVIADSALALGADREELFAMLNAQTGRRGLQQARLVIELADAGPQSAWETWVRYELLRAGLPRPAMQTPGPDRRWALPPTWATSSGRWASSSTDESSIGRTASALVTTPHRSFWPRRRAPMPSGGPVSPSKVSARPTSRMSKRCSAESRRTSHRTYCGRPGSIHGCPPSDPDFGPLHGTENDFGRLLRDRSFD